MAREIEARETKPFTHDSSSRIVTKLQKETGVLVAKSITQIQSENASMKKSISRHLKSVMHTSKGKNHNHSKKVKEIKKKYGWSLKRVFKVLGVIGVIALILTIIGASVAIAYAFDMYNKAPVINEENLKASQSSIVYARDGKTELFRYFGNTNRENVNLEKIPQSVQWAVIGLEQKDFYKQDIPWLSIASALRDCVANKFITKDIQCRGASGLAQQLYRNITGDKQQNIERKIRELFAAKKLLESNTKDEILELYLNWVSFGGDISGVQVAAQSYFGKDIGEVNIQQACLIASMPQNPVIYERAIYARNTPESAYFESWQILENRKNICLNNLYEYDIKGNGEKLIKTAEELDQLKKADIGFIEKRDSRKYPHWQDFIKKELAKIFPDVEELNNGGYKIVTTLDIDIQTMLDTIYDSDANKKRLQLGPVNNAAAVILDGPSGEILAMRGSMDYNNEDIDGQVNIVTSGQAPGSTMKLYDYAAALNNGFNPSTIVLDLETDFGGGYKPRNFSLGQAGAVTMTYALQNSLNIPAIRTAYLSADPAKRPDPANAMENVMELAEKAGLILPPQSDTCKTYIVASLGACDVTLLSHATAYNTFSQDGNLRTATPFIEITISPGKDITQEKADVTNTEIKERLAKTYPRTDGAVDPRIARQINSMLADADQRTFGSVANLLVFPGWKGKVAAKTGTATGGNNNQVTDLWTMGYTKKYTVVTWAGNTKNELVPGNVQGILVTSPTWQELMINLHKNLNPGDPQFTFSTEGLKRVNLGCPKSVAGGGRCANELVTPEQEEIVTKANASFKKADYQPFEKTIFENRNELISTKRYVSKLDRKLVDKDTYPAEYVEEVDCIIIVSAFPQLANWQNPANAYASKFSENKCNEISPIKVEDIGIQQSITPVLVNGQEFKNPITITAKGKVEGLSVQRIEFKVEGVVVDAADADTLTVDPETLGMSGKKFVTIRVIDNFGKGYETNFSEIVFNSVSEFSASDYPSLSDIDCSPNSAPVGANFNCEFNLPNNRSWSQGNTLRMYIGSNTTGANCIYQIVKKAFRCNGIPSSGNIPNPLGTPIKLKTSSQPTPVSTSSKVQLTL